MPIKIEKVKSLLKNIEFNNDEIPQRVKELVENAESQKEEEINFDSNGDLIILE